MTQPEKVRQSHTAEAASAPPRTVPYGSWPSPVTPDLVAQQATAYDAVHVAGGAVYWLATRPTEGGRTALVRWTAERGSADAVPPGFDVGTRVYEYGGGAYVPVASGADGQVALFASCLDDDRLYRLDPGRTPRPITPSPTGPSVSRYADLRLTADRRWLVCVHERRDPNNDATTSELVALPPDGSASPHTLTSDHDFYAAPRPSPDGRRLAWISWDRPQMPWDGSDLWVADVSHDGQLSDIRHIAGGADESIVQPEWATGGTLLFISDRTGWWNLYRCKLAGRHGPVGRAEPLMAMDAEFADAPWELDYSSYAPLADGRIACRYRQEGIDHLAVFHPSSGRLQPLLESAPYTSVKPYLHAAGGRLAFIAASPTTSSAVVTVDLASGQEQVLAGGGCPVPDGFLATSRPIVVAVGTDEAIHARYYPPVNRHASGPPGQSPPLLVQAHPGPTADAKDRLDLRVQFFTSRGFAVLDVNYRGSTGYGRAYRERLTGQWGVLDVQDCVRAARRLIASGDADPDRIVIAGASAGGYTALQALATPDLFSAGVSYYGIADLEDFRRRAPRFQAHQLDRLIGPYPQAIETYRARSPMQHADTMIRPVLLVHGAKDPVVPVAQAKAMARALQQRRVPHRLVVFPDEGHGLRDQTAIRTALEAELAFYRETLRL